MTAIVSSRVRYRKRPVNVIIMSLFDAGVKWAICPIRRMRDPVSARDSSLVYVA